MAPAPPTPERSLNQRMDALGKANVVRTRRAKLKRDIKAGKVLVHTLLQDPPDWLETMKIFDLVLSMPKYGRVKAGKILAQCRISPSKTVGGLSDRQRSELVGMMRRIKPPASTPRQLSRPQGNDTQCRRALLQANDIRLARAVLKDRVASGEITATHVILTCPIEAAGMEIGDLLISQHRWGATRSRRLLRNIPMAETKTLGSMSGQQRKTLARLLDGGEAALKQHEQEQKRRRDLYAERQRLAREAREQKTRIEVPKEPKDQQDVLCPGLEGRPCNSPTMARGSSLYCTRQSCYHFMFPITGGPTRIQPAPRLLHDPRAIEEHSGVPRKIARVA